MTKRERLLTDAKAAGFQVENKPGGATYIVRRHKRTRRILAGIVLWPNGTATRADVALDACLAIRTYAEKRAALGLKP